MCLRSATRPGSRDLGEIRVGVGRQRAGCRRRRLGAGQAVGGSGRQALPDVFLGDDRHAILGEGLVTAGVVAMIMGVDQIFDRQIGDGGDHGLDLVMERRELAVDHDDAVLCQCHGDVPANTSRHLALEHVDVVAEVGGLDLDLGEIDRWRGGGRLRLLRESAASQQKRDGNRRISGTNHREPPQGPIRPIFCLPPMFS